MITKTTIYLDDNVRASLTMHSPSRVVHDKGLDPDGPAQVFHTANCLRRIGRYMPYRTGMTYKITVAQTNIRVPEIVTDTPYAHYLWRGRVMIDPAINAAGFLTPEGWRSRKGCRKVLTDRRLQFDRSKNSRAGDHWDEALKAAEMPELVRDLENFMRRGR